MLVHWIWLTQRKWLGDRLRLQILRQFGDPEAVYTASDYSMVEGLTREGLLALQDKDLSGAEKILEECLEKQVSVLTIQDALYSGRLRNIPDPPLVLYYRGRVPELDTTAVIGVVGTRKASDYGLSAAAGLGAQLGEGGAVVVSGLAKGIDGLAMRGALSKGGTVVGVLGCGPDLVYPAANRELFAKVERYGWLVSEYPPGTPPNRGNFPRRNRIISGLSSGVLVVEAPSRSGALITAGLAGDQGRDVFVVPGRIDSETCQGSNALLRDGAGAVFSGWDILSEYAALYPDRIRKPKDSGEKSRKTTRPGDGEPEAEALVTPEKESPSRTKSGEKPQQPHKSHNSPIDNRVSGPYIDINDLLAGCSPQQQKILLALKDGPCRIDTVVEQTGIDTRQVLSALTMLEIRGLIRRHPGGLVSLKDKRNGAT